MTNPEQTLRRMLNDRAINVEVHPDLDAAKRGTMVVRLNPAAPPARRLARAMAGVGVAAALVTALVGLVLTGGDDAATKPATAGADPVPATAIYPVLGDLPPGFDAARDASFAVPDPANPSATAALIGRPGPGQWTEVTRVTALAERPALVPDESDTVALGGIAATRLANDDGSTHYSWQSNGVWVVMTTRVSDPVPLMLAVRVDADQIGGVPRLSFENLPPGFSVLAEATSLSMTPSPMVLAFESPTPNSPAGRMVSVEVLSDGVANAVGATGTISLIEINGSSGLSVTADQGALLLTGDQGTAVVWNLGNDHSAVLGTLGLSIGETIDLARAVTFVDETQWRELYKVGPGLPSVSTTTVPARGSSVDCPTGTDGRSGVTTTVLGCP